MFLRSIPCTSVKIVRGSATNAALLALGALAVSLGCNGFATDNGGKPPDLPTLGATIDADNSPDADQLGAPDESADDVVSVTFDAGPGFCCNPLSIEFNAELSDSTLARGAAFEWDLGDGRQAAGPTAHHTYSWAGEYQIVLQVRLPDGVTLAAEQTLHLGIGPQGGMEIGLSPTPSATDPGDEPDDTAESVSEVVADAGDDDEVAAGELVVLDGSGSTGAEPLTFSWRQLFGPPVTLDNPSGSLATFTAPSDSAQFATLVFELTVMQGSASDRDQVAISVSPAGSPVVVAPPDDPPDDVPDDPPQPDEDQIIAWLQELDPLPKVHYSWDFPKVRLSIPIDPLLFEFVRLTHGVSIRGETTKPPQANSAVAVCAQVNALNPAIPATIAINYSPWHRAFPPDAPPTDFGPAHDEEVALFREAMTVARDLIAAANAEQNEDIAVAFLLFDSERFRIKTSNEEGYEEWNAAITEKYNVIYSIGKELFPDAMIEWYGRGTNNRFTLEEMGDTNSGWLLELPFVDYTDERYQRLYDLAMANGADEVTLWVALASSFDTTDWRTRTWVFQWDYDLALSWQLGARIHNPSYGDTPETYAHWRAANPICFWPRPFDTRVGVGLWGKHFVAYVRGAHGIPDLP